MLVATIHAHNIAVAEPQVVCRSTYLDYRAVSCFLALISTSHKPLINQILMVEGHKLVVCTLDGLHDANNLIIHTWVSSYYWLECAAIRL